ncbi:hypothetical protein [Rhodobacter capsulatus]|jgi:hypothetical protein|uniref:hypothetical protein n=1 Tax=Rhodobacter capsulatus TaxID=1061 RepID=UPI0003D2CAB1|nr:hypothetical protein [Rhodobacter capsulatus]ETD01319.1 hypothetical protein U714_13040 [Rhodobacter capsulatus DE442]ETD75899.1 hypothetical protein U717_13205 [Rhodobacter capsulatus R121]ETE53169.1 hypothetical protein U715_13205 [Rhodobacter capsulatus Y262]
MPTFIDDNAYTRLLFDLRMAARAADWETALTEVLCDANILPATCRGEIEITAS